MTSPLPATLRTASPAEGLALARQFAAHLHAGLPPPADMAGHLQTGTAAVPLEHTAAILFNAIALANAGWERPAGV